MKIRQHHQPTAGQRFLQVAQAADAHAVGFRHDAADKGLVVGVHLVRQPRGQRFCNRYCRNDADEYVP